MRHILFKGSRRSYGERLKDLIIEALYTRRGDSLSNHISHLRRSLMIMICAWPFLRRTIRPKYQVSAAMLDANVSMLIRVSISDQELMTEWRRELGSHVKCSVLLLAVCLKPRDMLPDEVHERRVFPFD